MNLATSDPNSPPSRLRIGERIVDLASREVHVPGVRRAHRLTPKALAVLQVLARQPGQVVTREQLLSDVWPDTLPTNDVVTQAITQLRKMLGGNGQGLGAGIETIAKTGYRLREAVEWLRDLPVPDVPEQPARPDVGEAPLAIADPEANIRGTTRPRRFWLLLAMAILLLLAFGCGLLVPRWLREAASVNGEQDHAVSGVPALPYRLITSSGNFDVAPTLSPDGSMVAYTSLVPERPGAVVLVKTTNNAPPRVLSRWSRDEDDDLPAWSSDGRQIAFVRNFTDGRCRVMIASANGAADAHEVARCEHNGTLSFSWSPDGRALIFGSMAGDGPWRGMRRLDIKSGRWRDLDYRIGPHDFDYQPHYSPDGRWIAFIRNPQMGDLWLMPAAGGAVERLTYDSAELRGLAWLPDSSGLVFGRKIDSQSRLYRLDLATRRLRDLGLDDAQAPAISTGAEKLAFVQRKPKFGIYRIERDSQGGYRRRHLFASNGRDTQPTLAPDGQQLVFASDRSGQFSLWWADLAAADALRPIDGLVPETRQSPDWSPDSLSVLVVARERDGRSALYEVMPSLNRLARLAVPEQRPLQAVYLADPSRILILGASAEGTATLSLYDRSSRPWKRIASLEDVSQVRFDRRRQQILFTRFSSEGLWRVDAMLNPVSVAQLVADQPSRLRYRSWAVGADGLVRYLSASESCPTEVRVLESVKVRPPTVGCLDAASFSASNGFSVAADSAVYVALAREEGSSIGFMELPHEAAERPGFIPNLLINK